MLSFLKGLLAKKLYEKFKQDVMEEVELFIPWVVSKVQSEGRDFLKRLHGKVIVVTGAVLKHRLVLVVNVGDVWDEAMQKSLDDNMVIYDRIKVKIPVVDVPVLLGVSVVHKKTVERWKVEGKLVPPLV